MADLNVGFDELPIIHAAGMTAATVDGMAEIEMQASPHDWAVVAIELAVWHARKRCTMAVRLAAGDPQFVEIADAIAMDFDLCGRIGRELMRRREGPSAYDRARDLRETT